MNAHNIYFPGEIRNMAILFDENMCYLELWILSKWFYLSSRCSLIYNVNHG